MRISALALLAAAGLTSASVARSVSYEIPPETIPRDLSQPDAQLVQANCSGCHSLDYLTTQPRGKGAQFWRDAIKKMITVYGAPVAPADVEPLTTILEARFGKAPS